MIWILLTMLVILLLAGVVVVYAAFPHRGAEVPHLPWMGQALRRCVAWLPTLDNRNDHQHR